MAVALLSPEPSLPITLILYWFNHRKLFALWLAKSASVVPILEAPDEIEEGAS